MKTKTTRSIKISIKILGVFFLSVLLGTGIFLPSNKHSSVLAAGSATYTANADATVWSGEPNTNYGSITTNEVGYTPTDRFFFLKFPDVSIPADATITTATIKLINQGCGSSTSTLKLRRVTQSWAENTITYNNVPLYELSESVNLPSSCANKDFNVISMVNAWRGGTPNYGVAIYGPAAGSYLQRFYARESGTASVRPQLYIEYSVPDTPATPTPTPESTPTPTPQNTESGSTTVPGGNTTTDISVLSPKLTQVLLNNEELDLRDKAIETTNDDVLVIKGEGTAGQKVVLTIGDKEFTATINEAGIWSIELDMSEINIGNYDVFAKTVTSDNKESEKVKLFEFEKKEKEATKESTNTKSNDKNAKLKKYGLIVGAVLLVFIIGGTVLFIKMRKKKSPDSVEKSESNK